MKKIARETTQKTEPIKCHPFRRPYPRIKLILSLSAPIKMLKMASNICPRRRTRPALPFDKPRIP